MADSTGSSCQVYAIGLAIGWTITVVGWIVANIVANARETRKEKRSQIESFRALLDELLDASRIYYTSNIKEEQFTSSLDIHRRINRIQQMIENFDSDTIIKKQNNYPKFVLLYEAVTGGDFESKDTKRGAAHSERYKRIVTLSDQLFSDIERSFESHYQNK